MQTITISTADDGSLNLPDRIELLPEESAVIAPLIKVILNNRPSGEGTNPDIPGYDDLFLTNC